MEGSTQHHGNGLSMPQLGYQFHDTVVDGFVFADDWFVCAENQSRLKEKLEAAAIELGRAVMKINARKTKRMRSKTVTDSLATAQPCIVNPANRVVYKLCLWGGLKQKFDATAFTPLMKNWPEFRMHHFRKPRHEDNGSYRDVTSAFLHDPLNYDGRGPCDARRVSLSSGYITKDIRCDFIPRTCLSDLDKELFLIARESVSVDLTTVDVRDLPACRENRVHVLSTPQAMLKGRGPSIQAEARPTSCTKLYLTKFHMTVERVQLGRHLTEDKLADDKSNENSVL
ncbi:hypothetical protein T265_04003 [Opisthorchis viverrini]|uniref:Reverse transcriptase domain-containing protein n=1 Tax=Opisthorchis viverrini TaxID=6198 RepID=A0A074ZU34_OPIVI|nr:hypothetical protein T265_04003 [Opisthorchis viverrini]KER29342.1 hypothetical protein T265_04003 [Opisthorchis viverrini]